MPFERAKHCSFGKCTFPKQVDTWSCLNQVVFIDCNLSCGFAAGILDNVSNTMFYKVDFSSFLEYWNGKALESNSVYFSYKDAFGVFPLDVNPKNGNLLSRALEGLGDASFRSIQQHHLQTLIK